MKKPSLFFAIVICTALLLPGLWCGHASSAQKDEAGCKDHPLFTRMPNYLIRECKTKDFDQHEFYVAGEKEFVVEGKKTYISYEIKEGVKAPSEVQIKRNFENAVAKISSKTEFNSTFNVYLSIKKDGKETWVDVHPVNHRRELHSDNRRKERHGTGHNGEHHAGRPEQRWLYRALYQL